MKTISIKTAQNVQITFELAGLGQRFTAYLLDLVILGFYMFIITLTMENSGLSTRNEEAKLYLTLYFLLTLPAFFYSPMLEYITKGQTLGKKALGIRVMKVNGDNASLNEYFLRWLFKGLAFIILPIEAVVILISKRSQRLADMMANTVVVKLNPTFDYTLNQVLNLNKEKTEIEYPEVEQFTDEDMMFIKKVIQRVEEYNNPATREIAIELVHELVEKLQLPEVPKKKMTFLKKVLKDYVALTR
ncbi:RDD family protein [Lishizhenia sp.]|uniref:RDD family protein n=1 Tax=Lishizhenia sp. TaxID=2497594 RepID=UPI00299ECB11|nr:RDD family protein [Lishizhenia sp.]MDX1445813.1 RDD family protein [Lishizhenia sp.]